MAKSRTVPDSTPQITQLTVSHEEARAKIIDRIEKGKPFYLNNIPSHTDLQARQQEFDRWDSYNNQLLITLFSNKEQSEAYSWFPGFMSLGGRPSLHEEIREFQEKAKEQVHRLEIILEKLELFPLASSAHVATGQEEKRRLEINHLTTILRRFHNIARQLKIRHADRGTLIISDEYDVQDLLHAILKGLFDDVRAEDTCPSYAGGNSRVDFVLKSEQIVIEVKMANANLKDKQIGEQLLIDIARYSTHPDCKCLICFTYDPMGIIRNPAGLEADLSKAPSSFQVIPIILSV